MLAIKFDGKNLEVPYTDGEYKLNGETFVIDGALVTRLSSGEAIEVISGEEFGPDTKIIVEF